MPFIRRVVGSQKIVLVYATVILYDSQGRILLQSRTDLPFWGLPGGVLEWGESLEQCARRELREESGLEAGELHLVGLYSSPAYDVAYPNGDCAQQFTVCFAGQVDGGTMQVEETEVSQQRFVAPDALPDIFLPSWYADMISDWQQDVPPHMDRLSADRSAPSSESPDWPPPPDIPAIVATVALLVTGHDGSLAVYSSPLCVGESATDTAYRLAAAPERLLGLASGLSPGQPPGHRRRQTVVAWFLAQAEEVQEKNGLLRLLTEEAAADRDADDLPGLSLALSHRNGGYFVE